MTIIKRMPRYRLPRYVLILVVLGIAAFLNWRQKDPPAPAPAEAPDIVGAEAGEQSGARDIARAFAERRSDVWVEAAGEITRLLADDEDGVPHQRFILGLGGGQTVLVAHNLDLAPRVPLRAGSEVRLRGQYAWNPQGGVVHWTHHDPQGRHSGGWIEHEGRRYR